MIHLFKRFVLILLIAISFQATAQSALTNAKVDSLLHVLRLPALDSLLTVRENKTLSSLRIAWKKNRGDIKKIH